MASVGDFNGLQPCRGICKDQKRKRYENVYTPAIIRDPLRFIYKYNVLLFVMNNRVKSRDVCFLYFCILK